MIGSEIVKKRRGASGWGIYADGRPTGEAIAVITAVHRDGSGRASGAQPPTTGQGDDACSQGSQAPGDRRPLLHCSADGGYPRAKQHQTVATAGLSADEGFQSCLADAPCRCSRPWCCAAASSSTTDAPAWAARAARLHVG